MALGDVNASILTGYWTQAQFDTNPGIVLGAGQRIDLEQTGTYKVGDGVTALSVLAWLGASNIGANRIGVGDPLTGNLVGSTLALLDPDAGFQFYTDLTIRNTFNPINGTYSSLYLQRSDIPSSQLVLQSGEDGSFITAVNQGLILQATALRFKAVQDVIYFYTNTTTQKGYFDSNGFTVTDKINIGAGTIFNLASFTNLKIVKNSNSGAGIGINNQSTSGWSMAMMGYDDNQWLAFGYCNSTVAGNYAGTTIPIASSSFFQSGSGYDRPMIFAGSELIGLSGTSPSNRGYRADATGIRFDTNDTLDTVNTHSFAVGSLLTFDSEGYLGLYPQFSVGDASPLIFTSDTNYSTITGSGYFILRALRDYMYLDGRLIMIGSASDAQAAADIAPSDAGRGSLRIRPGVAPTVKPTGIIWNDGTNIVFGGGEGISTGGEIIQSFGSSQPFRISNRDVSLPFPVPMIMPVNNDQVIAFDIMPRGNPVESAGNGFAWMDICDTDCANTSPDFTTTRIGNTSAYVEFGSRRWGAAALKPLALTLDGTPFLLADPSGVTITSALLTLVGPGMVMGGAFINSDAGASIANNANINGERGITAYNANTGSGAWATFNVNSDTGEGAFRTYSSGFTFDSGNFTNKTHLLGTHGLVVSTNGSIDFLVNSFAFAAKTMSIGPTTISLPNIPTGNAGLVFGQVYKDTAANIAANGDLVLGIKV